MDLAHHVYEHPKELGRSPDFRPYQGTGHVFRLDSALHIVQQKLGDLNHQTDQGQVENGENSIFGGG